MMNKWIEYLCPAMWDMETMLNIFSLYYQHPSAFPLLISQLSQFETYFPPRFQTTGAKQQKNIRWLNLPEKVSVTND